jgi:hypothetical protein
MSQAIPAFTPPPSYPYQGNPQQQVSAALASSSSGMPGDSIAPIAIGVTAGVLLTAAAATLAVKHFSTSDDKPKPAQATSLQIESDRKPVSLPQSASPPQLTRQSQYTPSSQPPPQRHPMPSPLSGLPGPPDPLGSKITDESELIAIPGFPGFIYPSDDVYREENGPCGKCASNTIRYFYGGQEKLITGDAFEERVPTAGSYPRQLVAFAKTIGLHTECYVPRIRGTSISSIDDVETFFMCIPGHVVALVRPKGKKYFCLSDNLNQRKRETYPAVIQEGVRCTATDAFLDYQRRNRITADVIITVQERPSDHGLEPVDEGIIWNENIKARAGSPQTRKMCWIH